MLEGVEVPLRHIAIPLLLLLPTLAYAGQAVQRLVPPRHPVPGLTRALILVDTGNQSRALATQVVAKVRQSSDPSLLPNGAPERGIVWPGIDTEVRNGRAPQGQSDTVDLGDQYRAQIIVVVQAQSRAQLERSQQARTWRVVENGQAREESGTVPCAQRTVVTTGSVRSYSALTGELLDETPIDRTSSDLDCDEPGDDTLSVDSEDTQAEVGLSWAAGTAMGTLVPHVDTVQVPLVTEQATREAVRLARDDEWSAVRRASLDTLQDFPFNAPSLYHVGVALEMEGHWKEARELYAYARRIEDNSVYDRAIRRAEERGAELEMLERLYGMRIGGPLPADTNDLLQTAATAMATRPQGDRVEVRGGRNASVRVYSAASGGSEIARVGGGTRLYVLGHDGRDTEVQLPDGRSGWLRDRDLK